MSISLAIRTPADARPGAVTRGSVTVRNDTQQVLAAMLSVIGVDSWVALENTEIRLFPGDEGEVGLLMQPPCDASVAAGPHRFAVRAVASHDGTVSVTDETEINVLPWPGIALGLRPRNAHGARKVTTRLTLTNTGNVRQSVSIEGGDDDDLVDVSIRPAMVELEPGNSATTRVRVKRAANAGGLLPYWIRTDAEGPAGATGLEGSMTVRTRSWPVTPILLGAIALVIGVVVLKANAGSVHSGATDAAVPTTRPATATTTTAVGSEAPSGGSPVVETSAPPLGGVPEGGSTTTLAGAPKPAAVQGQTLTDPVPGGGPTTLPRTAPTPPVPGATTPVPGPSGSAPPPTTAPTTVAPPPGAKVPAAPAFVTATAGDGTATAIWGAPANLAAADISVYTLTWSSGSSNFGPLTITGLTTSFTGLTNGAPYTFTVTATSVDAATGPAASSAAVTPSGLPGAPNPLATVPPAGIRSAIITWPAVDPNGSPILNYLVTVNGLGIQDTLSGTATSHRIIFEPGMTPGPYDVTVTATNANGPSRVGTTSFDLPDLSCVRGVPCP